MSDNAPSPNVETKVRPDDTSFDRDGVLKIAAGEVFGANYPKLPLPNMLMVDRIVSVSENGGKYDNGLVVAELDINPDLWFFHCHFKGDPVMPGCLGLDAMWQLTGFYLAWTGNEGKGRALGVKDVRFTGQILPENKLVTYRIDIKRVIKRRLVMARADGQVEVDGEVIYTAEDLRVGLFAVSE